MLVLLAREMQAACLELLRGVTVLFRGFYYLIDFARVLYISCFVFLLGAVLSFFNINRYAVLCLVLLTAMGLSLITLKFFVKYFGEKNLLSVRKTFLIVMLVLNFLIVSYFVFSGDWGYALIIVLIMAFSYVVSRREKSDQQIVKREIGALTRRENIMICYLFVATAITLSITILFYNIGGINKVSFAQESGITATEKLIKEDGDNSKEKKAGEIIEDKANPKWGRAIAISDEIIQKYYKNDFQGVYEILNESVKTRGEKQEFIGYLQNARRRYVDYSYFKRSNCKRNSNDTEFEVTYEALNESGHSIRLLVWIKGEENKPVTGIKFVEGTW